MVWTIVSEFTVAECPRVRFRELDKVLVKGKEQPVVIYEPVALESDLDDDAKRELEFWDGYHWRATLSEIRAGQKGAR